jgi:uncharacterized membrane protein YozB (DUF420 family)
VVLTVGPASSQANLALQIIIFTIVLISFVFVKKRRFWVHGVMMLVAVVLNAFSFLWVMEPSFLSLEQFIISHPVNRISLATMAHGVLGATVEILGVWLVVSWGLRKSTACCVRKRRMMLVTLILWAITFFLGVLVYMLLYTTLL